MYMCDINFHCLCHTSPEVAYRRGSPFSVLRSGRQWCPSGAKGPFAMVDGEEKMLRIHSLQDAMQRSLGWRLFREGQLQLLFRLFEPPPQIGRRRTLKSSANSVRKQYLGGVGCLQIGWSWK